MNKYKVIVSWVVSDIGVTSFFVGVVGMLFPLWVLNELNGTDATVGYTLSIAMLINMIVTPFVGKLSDHISRRLPFVIVGILVSVIATLFLGSTNLYIGILLFSISVVAVYIANVIYGAMLIEISSEENMGKVNGFGVGVGYLGAIVAIFIGIFVVDNWSYARGFQSITFCMILSSIPLFLYYKDDNPKYFKRQNFQFDIRGILYGIKDAFIELKNAKEVSRFLFSRFWFTSSLYTAQTFAVVFGTDAAGFSAYQVQILLFLGVLVAIPGAIAWGFIVDKIGAKNSLVIVLSIWASILILCACMPYFNLNKGLWLLIGVITGVVISGVWASDRPYMITLVPNKNFLGQYLGYHAVTGRLAAIFGPFSWGFISTTLGLGQIPAVLTLAIFSLTSVLFIVCFKNNSEVVA